MREDLRERREKTWELLQVRGHTPQQVAETLGPQYDVKPETIIKDIQRMDDWLGKLDAHVSATAQSRLVELRKARQREQQIRLEMRRSEDYDFHDELKAIRHVERNLELDIEASQSVGETERVPDQLEADVSTDGTDRKVTYPLTEKDREHFDNLETWAEADTASTRIDEQGDDLDLDIGDELPDGEADE